MAVIDKASLTHPELADIARNYVWRGDLPLDETDLELLAESLGIASEFMADNSACPAIVTRRVADLYAKLVAGRRRDAHFDMGRERYRIERPQMHHLTDK